MFDWVVVVVEEAEYPMLFQLQLQALELVVVQVRGGDKALELRSEAAACTERRAAAEARLAEVEAKNRQLVESLATAAKNSRNSSKPPRKAKARPRVLPPRSR